MKSNIHTVQQCAGYFFKTLVFFVVFCAPSMSTGSRKVKALARFSQESEHA